MTETELKTVEVPRIAWGPVLVVGALVLALLLFTSTRFDYFFDELYFLAAGRDHAAWGYFDQPPLIPFLASLMDSIAPGSLLVLRLPVTLAATAGAVVTALIARELGGGRAAQVMAATAYACSGIMVTSHWLATYTLDPFLWTMIAWLLVRWVRVREDRLLLFAGLLTAVSLQTKFLIPAFWALVLAAALICGPRSLPTRPKLWLGAAIAVLATVPTLIWQASRGWPYLNMADVVAAEFPGVVPFLRDGVLGAGIGIGVVMFLCGLFRLVFRLRPYRFLGVAIVALVGAFLLTEGRTYYLFGVFAVPFAAAAVWFASLSWAKYVRWPVFVLSGIVAVAMTPVYPASIVDKLPPTFGPVPLGSALAAGERPIAEIGRLIGGVYHALPPERQARTAVFVEIYPFAAAAEVHGDLRAYSGHRGYWYFGPPPETADAVVFAGFDPGLLSPHFAGYHPVVEGLVWTFEGRKGSWAEIWPSVRRQ